MDHNNLTRQQEIQPLSSNKDSSVKSVGLNSGLRAGGNYSDSGGCLSSKFRPGDTAVKSLSLVYSPGRFFIKLFHSLSSSKPAAALSPLPGNNTDNKKSFFFVGGPAGGGRPYRYGARPRRDNTGRQCPMAVSSLAIRRGPAYPAPAVIISFSSLASYRAAGRRGLPPGNYFKKSEVRNQNSEWRLKNEGTQNNPIKARRLRLRDGAAARARQNRKLQGGLELVPARSHEPYDAGSNPAPAISEGGPRQWAVLDAGDHEPACLVVVSLNRDSRERPAYLKKQPGRRFGVYIAVTQKGLNASLQAPSVSAAAVVAHARNFNTTTGEPK